MEKTITSYELRMKVEREALKFKNRYAVILATVFALLFVLGNSSLLFGQQPQAPAGTPLYSVNAKYVNGMAPGYWPTAGSGLTLNLSAGTAYCGNPPTAVSYPGGSLALAASTTNYVYLDPVTNCAPAVGTSAFTAGEIPIATVVTGASSITLVSDARTWFTPQPCVTGSAGGLHCSSLGTNQNISFTPSGSGASVITNLEDKGGQVFNVKAYGATGDGATDDTTDVQAAITAASSGGTVFFPNGTYKITSGLSISNPVIIRCASPGSTTLDFSTLASGDAITFSYGNSAHAGIHDCKIEGPGSGSSVTGVMLGTGAGYGTSAFMADIEGNEITAFGTGIGWDGYSFLDRTRGNWIHGNGIGVDTGGENNQFENNDFAGNSTGMRVSGSTTVSVTGGSFDDNTTYAVDWEATGGGGTFTGVHFEDSSLTAFTEYFHFGTGSGYTDVRMFGGTLNDNETTGSRTDLVSLNGTGQRFSAFGVKLYSGGISVSHAVTFNASGQSGTLIFENNSSHIADDFRAAYANDIVLDAPMNTTASVSTPRLISTLPIQGPLQDYGGQVFNVKAYGAKGDGVTNDSPAFQAAYDAAVAAGGGTVFVPPIGSSSCYLLNTAINMTNDNTQLTVAGSGGDGLAQSGSTGRICANTGGVLFDITNGSGKTFRNLDVTAQKSGLSNPSTVGIFSGRNSSGQNGQNEHIIHCTFAMPLHYSGTSYSFGVYLFGGEITFLSDDTLEADYPLVATGTNNFNITSPFVTLSTGTYSETDLSFNNMELLTSGLGPAVYLYSVSDVTLSGHSWNFSQANPYPAGLYGYAFYIYDSHDIHVHGWRQEGYPGFALIERGLYNSLVQGTDAPSPSPTTHAVEFKDASSEITDDDFKIFDEFSASSNWYYDATENSPTGIAVLDDVNFYCGKENNCANIPIGNLSTGATTYWSKIRWSGVGTNSTPIIRLDTSTYQLPVTGGFSVPTSAVAANSCTTLPFVSAAGSPALATIQIHPQTWYGLLVTASWGTNGFYPMLCNPTTSPITPGSGIGATFRVVQ